MRLLLDVTEVTPLEMSQLFLSPDPGVAVLQQGSSEDGKGQVRAGVELLSGRAGMGREWQPLPGGTVG